MHFIPAYAIGWESETVSQNLPRVCPLVPHQSLATPGSHFKTYMPRRHPNSDSDFPIMQEEMSPWAVILRLSHKIPPAALTKKWSGCRWGRRAGWTSSNASKKVSAVLLEISYVAICSLPPVKKPAFIFLNKVTLAGPFTWTPRLVSVPLCLLWHHKGLVSTTAHPSCILIINDKTTHHTPWPCVLLRKHSP